MLLLVSKDATICSMVAKYSDNVAYIIENT